MSAKQIGFKRPANKTPDDWVKAGAEGQGTPAPESPTLKVVEPRKKQVRFTLDVDADLHARIKVHCARSGSPMSDVLRAVLEREFPA